MNYHVAINGVQSGPHSETEVREFIANGRLKPADLCWREGWPEWRPVSSAFESGVTASPVPAPVPAAPAFASRRDDDTALNEDIRLSHLNHEASIQGVGSLYCLGGVFLALAAIAGLVGAGAGASSGNAKGAGFGAGMAVVFGLLAVLQLWVGIGLRRLNPRAVIPASILSGIGLLAFPLGTLINGYVLYLIHSAKGKVVLGEGYRDIVAATPHIRYRTPVWLIVLVVLLVLLVVIGIGAAVASS